jgi:hypothetical protein
MSRHYAGTPVFRWLRKKLAVHKPTALGFGQWDKWEEDLKKNKPVAYFLTETLPDWLEKPAEWTIDPLSEACYYLRQRFIHRGHLIKTGLAPGRYHEFQSKILHGIFTELVDFVEVEVAWRHATWNSDEQNKHTAPFWRKHWILRWGIWRSAEAGLAGLRWETTLDNADLDASERSEQQAMTARELMLLYTWWTKIRKDRDEMLAWEVSGYNSFNETLKLKYGKDWEDNLFSRRSVLTSAETAERDRRYDLINQIEEQWHVDDEEMINRVVAIRRNLWT